MDCKLELIIKIEDEYVDYGVSESTKASTTEIQSTNSHKLTNAEKCKRYRQKKKDGTLNLKEIKIPKSGKERAKEYRERKKKEKQKLKEIERSKMLRQRSHECNEENKKRTNDVEQTLQDSLIKKQKFESQHRFPENCNSPTQICGHSEIERNNSFQAPYLQRNDCAQPLIFFHHDREIRSNGNSFFSSIIKLMNLSISPLQIREQLLASRFVNSCINPDGARAILSSETEHAGMNCVDIFAKSYNQNVCVHNDCANATTKKEERQFLHFRVNVTQSFIHLHLRAMHFTPLIEVGKNNTNIRSNEKHIANISFEKSIDAQFDADDDEDNSDSNDKTHSGNATSGINVTNFNVKQPIIYKNYHEHSKGHIQFFHEFKSNTFGHSCAVCDRLWWKNDLKNTTHQHDVILQVILTNYVCGTAVKACCSCRRALDNRKIPLLSTYNGFSFPEIPPNLPKLNLIEQRLISPRIPFMQIRRLRHLNGRYDIYGQVINVPVEVKTLVKRLPRDIQDDHCFYVHIENELVHETSDTRGLINEEHIKQWLTYLVKTPLYVHKKIKIRKALLNIYEDSANVAIDDFSEHIPIEDNLTAQQQTLIWDENKLLPMAPGQKSVPRSVLFEKYAEELSFPTIYGGQFRKYKDRCKVTTLMEATSELRRTDRRATDPQHLLYVAAKVMRHRVRTTVRIAFKHIEYDTETTKEDMKSEDNIHSCMETNLAFLRCIPNSAWYWAERKKDLFATIRQYGAPTAFMALSANETKWPDLLKLLYKLKNNGAEINDQLLAEMLYVQKAQLVNEDAITCAIYFHKLVNCILKILQLKNTSPFGKYRVKYYFKRIEFQHRGSFHAHILLWLDNAPKNLLNNGKDFTDMVDNLISVSESEASGNIELQKHKHTFTCYNEMNPNKKDDCICGTPFLPSRKTITLMPMKDTDSGYSAEIFNQCKTHYQSLMSNLANIDYGDFNDFYTRNNIVSDEHYYDIIRAGIVRPKLLYRRAPSEKWNHTFNPFVFHCLKSNMDFQIIQDEYTCASYVVEYVNKHNRGISNLQQMINQTMDENPKFDIIDITKKLSIDVVNAVEMSTQEAAWYLVGEPMAKSSVVTAYIPTIYPIERQRLRRIFKELSELDNDYANIMKYDWFDIYERRPTNLETVTLAQFVAYYNIRRIGDCFKRAVSRVIRYRDYDVANNFNDHQREMVLLHIPFRSEDNDVLAENKYIQIYEDNKDLIIKRRKEFEYNSDLQKILEVFQQLGKGLDEDEQLRNEANVIFEEHPYAKSR